MPGNFFNELFGQQNLILFLTVPVKIVILNLRENVLTGSLWCNPCS